MLQFTTRSVTKELLSSLPERSRRVVAERFGLGTSARRRTLEAIGKEYGVTRERIRQIENHSLAMVRESEAYGRNMHAIDDLKRAVHELGSIVSETAALAALATSEAERNHVLFLLTVGHHFEHRPDNPDFHARWHVDPALAEAVERSLSRLHEELSAERLVPESDFVQQFVRILKEEGVRARSEEAPSRWLAIAKRIARNPLGEWGRSDSPHVRIKNTRDFAYLTLKRHGSPMHFTEVAKGIRELFDRNAHPATTHNELIKDSRFVLVGRGLYALKEWGYAPGVVREVIKNIIAEEGPLLREDIIERVKRERYVKDATIAVNLQSDAFTRGADGRYSIAS